MPPLCMGGIDAHQYLGKYRKYKTYLMEKDGE
jgi:hypothetical protein